VSLHDEETDKFGLPIPVVSFGWGENDKKLKRAGVARQRQILDAAGAEATFTASDTAHLMGACRMGSDPSTSVVDRDCAAWDTPGLYICDGSVFVTSSASNPSLTIQAIAARTAEHLVTPGRRHEL
jgi:choline dehydrogenase-like flavoprotein